MTETTTTKPPTAREQRAAAIRAANAAQLLAEQKARGVQNAARRDADVLAGVTRPATETEGRPAPKTTTRKAPTAKAPAAKAAPKAPARKTPAKAAPATTARRTAKPAAKATPAKATPAKRTTKTTTAPPKAEQNGHSTRETNQELARKLASLAAEAFGSASPEAKAKVAYWLHSLPTGGEGGSWNRWWPESLPRPATADWRKPE
jgi:hypothetical protein